MVCENRYTLPCGKDCGWWMLPILSEYTGTMWIEWEYEGTTYQKMISVEVGKPIWFLWPFQTYGLFVFRFLDSDKEPLTFTINGDTYDCFNAIAIPEYQIPTEEREYLESLCIEIIDPNQNELSSEMRIQVRLDPDDIEFDPPEEGHVIEGEAFLRLQTLLDGDEIVVTDPDPPGDHEVESIAFFRIRTDVENVQLGVPPGFAYLLDGEDLVMQAFGFRLLTPIYSGPCCQVQRWTDGATLTVWWNNGWRDDTAISNFLKGNPGGLRRWYNQQGPGGDWQQPLMGLQPQIGDAGGPIKLINGPLVFPSVYFPGTGQTFNGAGVGPWNGSAHNAHAVVLSETIGQPDLGNNPAGMEYFGYHANIAVPHFNFAGTPASYINSIPLIAETAIALRGTILETLCHVWMNSMDFSTWNETTFGIGIGQYKGYLQEWVVFNENANAKRLAKTGLTMPIYGL